MKLPERVFNHPVARAIIDQRKELVIEPGARSVVADTLSDLRERPRFIATIRSSSSAASRRAALATE